VPTQVGQHGRALGSTSDLSRHLVIIVKPVERVEGGWGEVGVDVSGGPLISMVAERASRRGLDDLLEAGPGRTCSARYAGSEKLFHLHAIRGSVY